MVGTGCHLAPIFRRLSHIACAEVAANQAQLVAFILAVPLLSVVTMAWLSGNPFTTSVLGAVFIGLTAIGWQLPKTPLSIAVGPLLVPGLLMVLFGLVYPHFLGTASFLTYLYAAPIGIVPCPTLSVLVGFSIILGSMGSRSWGLLLGAAGIFYGAFVCATPGCCPRLGTVPGGHRALVQSLEPGFPKCRH